MAKHTEAAPKLPPASIDFNALHEACRKGKAAANALNDALILAPRTLAEGEKLEEAPLPAGATAKVVE